MPPNLVQSLYTAAGRRWKDAESVGAGGTPRVVFELTVREGRIVEPDLLTQLLPLGAMEPVIVEG